MTRRAAAITLLDTLHRTRQLEARALDGLRAIWPDVANVRAVYPDVETQTVSLISAVLGAGDLPEHWLYERNHTTGRVGVIIHDAGTANERTYDITEIEALTAYLHEHYPEAL